MIVAVYFAIGAIIYMGVTLISLIWDREWFVTTCSKWWIWLRGLPYMMVAWPRVLWKAIHNVRERHSKRMEIEL